MKYVFLAVFLSLLLIIACFSAPNPIPEEEEVSAAVELITATDMHYLAPTLTDHGAYFRNMIASADGKVSRYSEELLEAFVRDVIGRAPDALILSGDLTFNGARASHEALAEKLARIEQAGIPVLVMPGNHDLNNPQAAFFHGDSYTLTESVTAGEFETIYGDFGFREAHSRDSASLSYTCDIAPGLRVLMLDVNAVESPGAAPAETLAWVEEQLALAEREGVRVLAVSHQNLLAHSSLLTAGFVVENRSHILALYESAGVIANLSGHVHMQHTAQSHTGLTELVTGSLAVWPCRYGVLSLWGGEARYETAAVDVSAWAREQGRADAELLDFSAYARDFAWQTAFRQGLAALGEREDGEAMAAFLADVNVAYFSGRVDVSSWDETLWAAWRQSDTFFGPYLDSIAREGTADHTMLSFAY